MTSTRPSDPSKGPVTLDHLFVTLSRAPRRRILEALRQKNPRTKNEFLELTYPEKQDHDQIAIELYHNHLPRLAEAGFIDWDQETDAITKGPRFEEIRPLLTLLHDHQDELPDWP